MRVLYRCWGVEADVGVERRSELEIAALDEGEGRRVGEGGGKRAFREAAGWTERRVRLGEIGGEKTGSAREEEIDF